ncbi:MAG: hypothetical protein KF757_03535 [Phycisphaeraceae bacterium]|nr:hypothetical protein [Phycisphaeraceae bacterium]MCW5763076.1 hypothetical protein [Phycisphaeraceae bacterium]
MTNDDFSTVLFQPPCWIGTVISGAVAAVCLIFAMLAIFDAIAIRGEYIFGLMFCCLFFAILSIVFFESRTIRLEGTRLFLPSPTGIMVIDLEPVSAAMLVHVPGHFDNSDGPDFLVLVSNEEQKIQCFSLYKFGLGSTIARQLVDFLQKRYPASNSDLEADPIAEAIGLRSRAAYGFIFEYPRTAPPW